MNSVGVNMYEIELRALVDDFDSMKEKLDSIAKVLRADQREVTIFFDVDPGIGDLMFTQKLFAASAVRAPVGTVNTYF